MRGRRDVRRGGVPKSLTQRVAAILAGGAWLEARSCSTSGGNVVAFLDKLDAAHAVAVSGTLAAPTSNASFGGSLTATIAGGGTVTAGSNRGGSFWKRWNAANSTVIHIFRPNATAGDLCIAATCDVTQGATQVGYYYGASGAGTSPKDSLFVVTNGTGTPANGRIVADLETGAYLPSAATFARTELTASAFAHYVKSTLVGSGALAGAISAADSTQPLRLFNNHSFSLPYAGDWWGSMFIPKIPSAAELAAIYAYITRETGITP